MDNRLGCYVALEAARLVAEAGGAPGDVAAVAVAQEEITFAGARTTAYSLRPDVAIVVDVTFATDAPGIDEKELGKHPFGSGPVIGRGSTLDPHGLRAAARGGRGRGHPVHGRGLARATRAPTPTRSTSRAPASRPRVVSVPLRYMHSPVEMVQLDDVENAAKLIAAFALRLSPDLDLSAEPAAAPLRHRRHAAAAGLGGARAGAACGGRRGPRAWRARRRRGRGGGADGRGDRARHAARRRRGGRPSTRTGREVAARAVEAYAELCPADLAARVAPGMAELLEALAGAPGESRLVARHRQPRADRPAQARRAGHRRTTSSPARAASARTPRTRRAAARSPAPAPATGRASGRS